MLPVRESAGASIESRRTDDRSPPLVEDPKVLTHVVIVLVALAAALAGSPAKGAAAEESAIVVYVGTYTDGESRGIYRFALDPVSGEASVPGPAAR